MKILVSILVTLALLVGANHARDTEVGPAQEAAGEAQTAKPKYTIKQVMVDVHKGGLLKTVQGGKGTKEDKLKLLEYYVALYENKPKKGETPSWTALSAQAMAAAAKLVVDEKAKPTILRAATNCKACHDNHK